MDARGINYLRAKFQINILKTKKLLKLRKLELWQLWLKRKNSEYNRVALIQL